jgi:carboxyvinyl-carboxyphosphonate phosphorylmutase
MASMIVLGAPDWMLLTLTELADLARRICRADALPLMVDADHGYGNALNAKRTVEELEGAGVAAIIVEDTLLPQPYAATGPGLVSVEEGVGRLRAALAGRSDPSLIVVARTNSPALAGAEEAVKRCKAYEAAGVDALFLWGATRESLEGVSAATRLPIIVARVGKDIRDRDYLAEKHVRLLLQGHTAYLAAIERVREVYAALRSGVEPSAIQPSLMPETAKALLREADYKAWREAFLKISAGGDLEG